MAKLILRQNLVFWILCAYAGLLLMHLGIGTFSGYEQYRESRGFFLQHVLRLSRPLLKDNRGRELSKYLRDAQSTGLVDFFEFEWKDKMESGGDAPRRRPVLSEPVTEQDGWVWGRAESTEITLRIGSGYGLSTRFALAWNAECAHLPVDLMFLIVACGLSMAFQRRVRRQTARGVVEGAGKRETKRAKVIRQELVRKPDAGEFTGVCGRSSILNQAELVAGADQEKFFSSLEEFYADCAAILGRYRGKLHGVHGHELLYFFAEKDQALETRLAIAAARDLEAIASRRGFRFVTSLSHGHLHGAHLLSGFALFGAPVEETGDQVQAMTSQKVSAIWASEALAKFAEGAALFQAPPSGARKLHAKAFVSASGLEDALVLARKGNFSELSFHRGDEALEAILRSLTVDQSWDKEIYVGVVNELRQVSCRRCGHGVVEAYRALLATELGRKDSYRLSSALALASTLLSRSLVDRALEKLFLQAVAVKDRRVRANAVELFTKLFPEREIPELRPLIRDEDNRVSANALIKAACERFDEKVIARIEERVRGGSVAHVASALHAMGEIALYYRKHDPLFLGSKLSFLRLFEGVSGWVNHPNTMIRRQALIAASKLQSEPLDSRLRELFATCDDPEMLGLFGTVYGWRKDCQPDRAAA